MSDETKPQIPERIPENIGKILLEPLNFGLAASSRKALEMGVPAHSMIEMLLNHLASVVSLVEPSGAREAVVGQIVSAFSPMVGKHFEARNTTPGGIILPRGVSVPNGDIAP